MLRKKVVHVIWNYYLCEIYNKRSSNTIIIVSVSLIVQQTDLTQTIIFQAITVLEAAQGVNTVINVHIPITTTWDTYSPSPLRPNGFVFSPLHLITLMLFDTAKLLSLAEFWKEYFTFWYKCTEHVKFII